MKAMYEEAVKAMRKTVSSAVVVFRSWIGKMVHPIICFESSREEKVHRVGAVHRRRRELGLGCVVGGVYKSKLYSDSVLVRFAGQLFR